MADVTPDIQKHPPLNAAARLVSGGLSFLLVLAFALASGVPTGRVLATAASSGATPAGAERAVAPQIVERQTHQRQQERPDTVTSFAGVLRPPAAQPSIHPATAADRSAHRLREALLALPPPAA